MSKSEVRTGQALALISPKGVLQKGRVSKRKFSTDLKGEMVRMTWQTFLLMGWTKQDFHNDFLGFSTTLELICMIE